MRLWVRVVTIVWVTTRPLRTHPLMVSLSPLLRIHSGIYHEQESANERQDVLSLQWEKEADWEDRDLEMTSQILDPTTRSAAVALSKEEHRSMIEACVGIRRCSESNGERS